MRAQAARPCARRVPLPVRSFILLLLVPMLASCESQEKRARRLALPKQVTAQYDKETGRLRVLSYDSNGDGKPDHWSYMDGTRVLRVEIDRNFDGKVDRWEYYDEKQQLSKVGFSSRDDGKPDSWAYQAPEGMIGRIERSTWGDGKVDRWEYYEKGDLVRAESDTDRDGRVDKWEYWARGRLARVEFDLAHSGRPTRRLVYGKGGALLRIESDPKGDGSFVEILTPRGPPRKRHGSTPIPYLGEAVRS